MKSLCEEHDSGEQKLLLKEYFRCKSIIFKHDEGEQGISAAAVESKSYCKRKKGNQRLQNLHEVADKQ